MATAEGAKRMDKVKKELRSVLLACKGGVDLRCLDQEYKQTLGRGIPYLKLGYGSLREFVHSIDDTVRLNVATGRCTAVPNDETRHVAELVAKQQNSGRRGHPLATRRFPVPATRSRVTMVPSHIQKNVLSLLLDYPRGLDPDDLQRFYRSNFMQKFDFQAYGFDSIDRCLESMDRVASFKYDRGSRLVFASAEHQRVPPQPGQLSVDATSSSSSVSTVPPKVQERMRRIMRGEEISRKGIALHKFQRVYKDKFNEALDPRTYGFPAMARMCDDLPEVFQLKMEDSQHKLYPSPSLVPAAAAAAEAEAPNNNSRRRAEQGAKVGAGDDDDVVGERDPLLKQYLVRLLERRGEVLAGQLMEDKLVGGHGDLVGLLRRMAEEKLIVYQQGDPLGCDDDWNNWTVSLPPARSEKQQLTSTVPSVVSSDSTAAAAAAADGCGFRKQELPSDLAIGDLFEVFVNEIFTPSRFFVCLKRHDCAFALGALMQSMTEFYSNPCAKEFTFTISSVVIGEPCAVQSRVYGWSRAAINRMVNLTDVEVYLVDYGSTLTTPISALRHLTKDFFELPLQGLEARCADIDYADKRWSSKARERFVQLVSTAGSQGMVAVYRGVHRKAGTEKLSLVLFDMASNDLENGININCILMEEGFAKYDPCALATNNVDGIKVVERMERERKALPINTDMAESLPPLRKPIFAPKLPAASGASAPASATAKVTLVKDKHDLPMPDVTKTVTDAAAAATAKVDADSEGTVEVLPFQLVNDISIHVIVMNGEAHVSSAEISALFPRWKGKNLLDKMLHLKGVRYDGVKTFNSPPHFWLLEVCVLEGIDVEETKEGGRLTVYPLSHASSIYKLFGGTCQLLLEALERLVERFDSDEKNKIKLA